MQEKRVSCASYDISCSGVAQVEGGRVTRLRASDSPAFKDSIELDADRRGGGAT